jgi:3-oxoacyl-[acyl-carrier protein] reductase
MSNTLRTPPQAPNRTVGSGRSLRQAIGIGGDRLQIYTHPEAAATEYHEGGWSSADIAAAFTGPLASSAQSVGEKFPPLPDDLVREPAK